MSASLAQSPGAGSARAQLAYEYDRDLQYLNALNQLIIVRVSYPEFISARYRLAASLALYSTGPRAAELLNPETDPLVPTVRAQLNELARLNNKDTFDIATMEPESREAVLEVRRFLNRLARAELKATRRQYRTHLILFKSIRRAERPVWLPLLFSARRRAELATVRTARRLERLRRVEIEAAARPFDADEPIGSLLSRLQWKSDQTVRASDLCTWTSDVVAMTRRPRCGAQAQYNAGCYFSMLAALERDYAPNRDDIRDALNAAYRQVPQADRPVGSDRWAGVAVRHLTTSLRELEGEPASRWWLDHDPDLEPLRGHEQFLALKAEITSDSLDVGRIPVGRELWMANR